MRTLRVSMELSTRTFVDLAIMFAFVPTRAIRFPFASVIVMIFAHTFVVFPSAPVLIAVAQLPVVPPFALVIIMIIDMHMPVEFPFAPAFVVVIAMHVPVESPFRPMLIMWNTVPVSMPDSAFERMLVMMVSRPVLWKSLSVTPMCACVAGWGAGRNAVQPSKDRGEIDASMMVMVDMEGGMRMFVVVME